MNRGSGRGIAIALAIVMQLLMGAGMAAAGDRDSFPGRRCAPAPNGGISCT